PLLQALAANSPFWHGRDSGLASARAEVFRAFPSSEIPPAFGSYDEYAEHIEVLAAAGALRDYTYLWWDIRPHPVLGTVEVRAMDSQSSLSIAAGLAALVHGLARRAVEEPGPWERREVLTRGLAPPLAVFRPGPAVDSRHVQALRYERRHAGGRGNLLAARCTLEPAAAE